MLQNNTIAVAYTLTVLLSLHALTTSYVAYNLPLVVGRVRVLLTLGLLATLAASVLAAFEPRAVGLGGDETGFVAVYLAIHSLTTLALVLHKPLGVRVVYMLGVPVLLYAAYKAGSMKLPAEPVRVARPIDPVLDTPAKCNASSGYEWVVGPDGVGRCQRRCVIGERRDERGNCI